MKSLGSHAVRNMFTFVQKLQTSYFQEIKIMIWRWPWWNGGHTYHLRVAASSHAILTDLHEISEIWVLMENFASNLRGQKHVCWLDWAHRPPICSLCFNLQFLKFIWPQNSLFLEYSLGKCYHTSLFCQSFKVLSLHPVFFLCSNLQT